MGLIHGQDVIAVQARNGTLFQVVPKTFTFTNPENFSNFSEMLTDRDAIHFVSPEIMDEVMNSESDFVELDLSNIPSNVQIHVVTPVAE